MKSLVSSFLTASSLFGGHQLLLVAGQYTCGPEDTTYETEETALLCLVFDQMDPPQKVVFSPKVDKFEAL